MLPELVSGRNPKSIVPVQGTATGPVAGVVSAGRGAGCCCANTRFAEASNSAAVTVVNLLRIANLP
jgi:hypothetical protein